jgi:hypothetical protein
VNRPRRKKTAKRVRELTATRLRKLLTYSPATGEFRWKSDRGPRVRAGDLAGTINSAGYRIITIDQGRYVAHRLAVLYMTGKWPIGVVDHRNADRTCNAWENLRDCTVSENNRNRKSRGCTYDWRKRKWIAQIVIDGKQRKLGRFNTETEATAAHRQAAADHHGEFSVTARQKRRAA